MPNPGREPNWPPRWDLPPDVDPQARADPVASVGDPQAVDPASPAGYALPPGVPGPAAVPPRAAVAPDRTRVAVIGGAVVVELAALATLLVVQPWSADDGPPASSGGAGGPQPASGAGDGGVASVRISADCTSPPSKDSGGNPTAYLPEFAVDDRLDTAWRCDGDGVGHALQIDFGRVLTLSDVGIVPGLAKTDPYDGTDRYRQCRRISAVRYTFDGGTSVTQQLDTDPANRSVQRLRLSSVTSRTVMVTVLSSVEGSAIGSLPPTDKVALSLLTWSTV